MVTTKIINTYKDGLLTSSKSIEVDLPSPKYSESLDIADASACAFKQAAHQLESLVAETKKLRKKLLQTEQALYSRTKERDAIKKALVRRTKQATLLKNSNEKLSALLAATQEDNQEDKQKLKTEQKIPLAAFERVQVRLANDKVNSALKLLNEEAEINTERRAIAAKPVSKAESYGC